MDLGLVLDSQKTGFETTSLYCTTEHKKYTSIYHCFTIQGPKAPSKAGGPAESSETGMHAYQKEKSQSFPAVKQ